MTRGILVALASLPLAALAQSAGTRAVPTYEAVGLYWSNPGADAASGCEVRFRKPGAAAWTNGLTMWFDARNNECRGSLVGLSAGTTYDVELNLPGQPVARRLSFTTWANQKPIARTISVSSSAATLNVTEGGSAAGYVLYQGAAGAVLDVNNAAPFNVTINAPYVILRGLVLRGAQQDAIRISPNVTDVVIEDNDISGWGRLRTGSWGMEMDSAIRAVCATPTLERVTIQRNVIHDPRYGANSWSDGHPEGPQAITFSSCGGNHVIRHNEIFSSPGHYYNDIIGGEDNFSSVGFPNADTDIYGNDISHAWDDAIEAEGANRNVRIWGNYIDQTGTGIASTVTASGPLYVFRNVYNRSRLYEKLPLDDDDRQQIFKAGSDPAFGDGRRYLFHNTMLQAVQAGARYTLGGGRGLSGSGPTQPVNNTVSKNNIYHIWQTTPPWITYRQIGTGNDFAHDMFNGDAGASVTNAILAAPTYASGNGWVSEAGGRYALQPGTPGHDAGARIANFNDDFIGAAPDVGAHESGALRMRFGIAASPGSSIAPTPVIGKRHDLNGDGTSDILIRNTADATVYGWLMNGLSIASGGYVLSAGSGWTPVQLADLNGDGRADLLIQHADGSLYAWLMNGLAVTGGGYLLGASSGWSVSHIGDFNGDGKQDLLLRHTDGSIYIWLMDGATIASGTYLQGAGTGWSATHVADFNGDGRSDVLLKHTNGSIYIWQMNGIGIEAGTFLKGAGIDWSVTDTGDFNGDGKADILITHTNGGVYLWQMNGTAIQTGTYLLSPGSGWSIARTADLDGDGRADILIAHTDGSLYAWMMNGLTISGGAYLLGAATGWSVSHARDLDGDGRADLMLKHTDGSIYAWIMDGATIANGAYLMGAGSWRVSP